MSGTRKDFLKLTGLAGLSTIGATMLSGCSPSDAESQQNMKKNWRADPEWRKAKYGPWSGPGVSEGTGPMDGVLLKDYAPKSTVVTQETFVPKAKYPAIDVHVHDYPDRQDDINPKQALDEWVKTQEEVGVETSVILTGATGDEFDQLVEFYLEPYPDQFQLYCGVEKSGIDKPDYPGRAVAELERCYSKGARGIGEISDKGFGIARDRDLPPEQWLHHDDERLDGFWEKAAELKMPANVHIADHPSSWRPPDVYQERTPIFQQYNQYGSDGLSYEEIHAHFPRLLEKHPNTTFIACHLANMGNDLGRLSSLMDQHSNLYLDISARDYEVGRQPRGAAKFMAKYQNRVLFGTDMGMDKSMYQSWWRLLESDDEHWIGRVWWRYYSLDLPDPVLRSFYSENAKRIMNWEQV